MIDPHDIINDREVIDWRIQWDDSRLETTDEVALYDRNLAIKWVERKLAGAKVGGEPIDTTPKSQQFASTPVPTIGTTKQALRVVVGNMTGWFNPLVETNKKALDLFLDQAADLFYDHLNYINEQEANRLKHEA